jgi:DNA-directed RNA polymerase specialized sigma24 family protein
MTDQSLPEPRTLADVRSARVPETRAVLAGKYLERLDRARMEAVQIRREAIGQMRQAGMKQSEIARRTGVSVSTVKLCP